MKFTNEKLIEMVDNAESCEVHLYGASLVGDLAKEFLTERTEREKNPGVWDGAPDNADLVELSFWSSAVRAGLLGKVGEKQYTRTLPKTKAREIAEAKARIWANGSQSIDYQKNLADIIESAINEALGGEK